MIQENTKAWLAYSAVAIFWGTTFLAIKVAIHSFPPFALAAFRHTSAGIILVSYFLIRGYKLPQLKTLGTFAINGFLMLTMGNGIISWGMQYVDSGLAALFSALTPIWIVLINHLCGNKEKGGLLVAIGFVLCIIGSGLIFYNHSSELSNISFVWGLVAVFISNVCWAGGTVYSKNHQTMVHPLFGAGLQMIPGGIICAIIAGFTGEFKQLNPEPNAIFSLIYLIAFGSILAYGSYMYIIKKLPAITVSTYAYVNTIVAVIIGWLWLNEQLTFALLNAMIFTIGGVFLINYSIQKQFKN